MTGKRNPKTEQDRKETDENFFFKLIWKSLEETAINWNLSLSWVISSGETNKIYCYRVYGAKKTKERQTQNFAR